MASEDRPESRRLDRAGEKKKPFAPPRLYVYGDITTVTQNVGMNGGADVGGEKGNTKSG